VEGKARLFRLIDWMMTLADRLEREFRAELRQYQEECQMPYVTSIERLAKEEGIQEGRLETSGKQSLTF
jgi:tRNA A37 threonylcarbamoyladenosine dehydratase